MIWLLCFNCFLAVMWSSVKYVSRCHWLIFLVIVTCFYGIFPLSTKEVVWSLLTQVSVAYQTEEYVNKNNLQKSETVCPLASLADFMGSIKYQ